LTSIILQLLSFITSNVFEVQDEYFAVFASLLFAKNANHLPKTSTPSSNYYNAFTIDIPIALLGVKCHNLNTYFVITPPIQKD
jgi:hypothetical protein